MHDTYCEAINARLARLHLICYTSDTTHALNAKDTHTHTLHILARD